MLNSSLQNAFQNQKRKNPKTLLGEKKNFVSCPFCFLPSELIYFSHNDETYWVENLEKFGKEQAHKQARVAFYVAVIENCKYEY